MYASILDAGVVATSLYSKLITNVFKYDAWILYADSIEQSSTSFVKILSKSKSVIFTSTSIRVTLFKIAVSNMSCNSSRDSQVITLFTSMFSLITFKSI